MPYQWNGREFEFFDDGSDIDASAPPEFQSVRPLSGEEQTQLRRLEALASMPNIAEMINPDLMGWRYATLSPEPVQNIVRQPVSDEPDFDDDVEFMEQMAMPIRKKKEKESIMYTIKDNLVQFYNLCGKDSRYKLIHDFHLKVPAASGYSDFDTFLKTVVKAFSETYETGTKLEKNIANNLYAVCKEPLPRMANFEITRQMLHNIITNFQNQLKQNERSKKENEVSLINSIARGASSDVAAYLYRIEENAQRCILLEECLAQFKALRDGETPFALMIENRNIIQMLSKEYSTMLHNPDGNVVKNKFVRWQYKTLALNTGAKDMMMQLDEQYRRTIEISNTRSHDPATGCVKIVMFNQDPNAKMEVKPINLEVLYPNLNTDIAKLKSSLKAYTDWRVGMSFEWAYLDANWKLFSDLKCNLMFAGLKELEAANLICDKTGIGKLGMCQISNQIIPEAFLVKVKDKTDTILFANAYILNNYNRNLAANHGRHAQKYNIQSVNGEDMWVETKKMTSEAIYRTNMYNHLRNPLEFLLPQALPRENIKPYTEDKGYRPTPYLGVELEVERKDKDGEWTNVPDNVPMGLDTPVRRMPDGQLQMYTASTLKENEDVTDDVLNLLGRDFVILKYDGSLRGYNPFEIVSAPATIAYHKEKWKAFLNDKDTKAKLQSFTSGHCGMHIHISRDSFTGLHLAKFMRFFNMEDNTTFITKIAQRSGNNYSQFRPKASVMESVNYIRQTKSDHNNHFQAINTSNEKTIEVRIFRGNLAKTAFLRNLEFVHAAWMYTMISGMTSLSYKDFLFWLFDPKNNHHKLYSHLEKWLIASDLNVSNIQIKADTPEDIKTRLLDKRKQIKKIQQVNKRRFETKCKIPRETPEELLQSA